MRNSIELVTSIMEMDKEIEYLKVKCESLIHENESLKKPKVCGTQIQTQSQIELIAMEFGKKQLFESIYNYYSNSVIASRNEDKEVIYKPYDEWVESIGYDKHIPVLVSKKDIIEFLSKELRELYEKECNKAYKLLLKREQEEPKEDEE